MLVLSSLARWASLLAIFASVCAPGPSGRLDEIVLVGALLAGLPHGALDDHVESWLSGGRRGRLVFYVAYLSGIVLVALLWWASPVAALLMFLLAAGLHFGEADTQGLQLPSTSRWLLAASRGLLVIALPLVVWPVETWPNVAALIGSTAPAAPAWLPSLTVPLLAQHLTVYGVLAADEPEVLGDAALLTVLFLFATPSLSLAVYFGLWHAPQHLEVLRSTLRWDSLGTVLRRAAPLTAASASGLLVLVLGMVALGKVPQLLIMVLLLISGLTLPHALLTHLMLRRLRPAQHLPIRGYLGEGGLP